MGRSPTGVSGHIFATAVSWLNVTIIYVCFFSLQTMTSVFEKFKEKKQNVVSALRDAADAVYLTVSTCVYYLISFQN